jgi:hypothetical protein
MFENRIYEELSLIHAKSITYVLKKTSCSLLMEELCLSILLGKKNSSFVLPISWDKNIKDQNF